MANPKPTRSHLTNEIEKSYEREAKVEMKLRRERVRERNLRSRETLLGRRTKRPSRRFYVLLAQILCRFEVFRAYVYLIK